jgi:hypothetical protein
MSTARNGLRHSAASRVATRTEIFSCIHQVPSRVERDLLHATATGAKRCLPNWRTEFGRMAGHTQILAIEGFFVICPRYFFIFRGALREAVTRGI